MRNDECYLLLALPDDVFCSVLERWLMLRDIVSLDSAICNRSIRILYLHAIRQCRLRSNQGTCFPANQCIDWRASRCIKGLEMLSVRKVSDAIACPSAGCAEVLKDVKTLFIVDLSGDKVTRWLELAAPLLANLDGVCGFEVRCSDIEWLKTLGKCAKLRTLYLTFGNKGYLLPSTLLHHFAYCTNLKFIELRNYCCNGIESILARNTNLVEIVLGTCNSISDATFALLLNLPSVQRIELTGNARVIGDGAFNITTTLQTLHLTFFHMLTEPNTARILNEFLVPKLMEVKLMQSRRITSAFADKWEPRYFKRLIVKAL